MKTLYIDPNPNNYTVMYNYVGTKYLQYIVEQYSTKTIKISLGCRM